MDWYQYDFDDRSTYIPIHLNIISDLRKAEDKDGSFYKRSVNDSFTEILMDYLYKLSSNTICILDFERVHLADKDSNFENLVNRFEDFVENRLFIFINLDKSSASRFSQLKKSQIVAYPNSGLVLSIKCKPWFTSVFSQSNPNGEVASKEDIVQVIQKFRVEVIKQAVRENVISEPKKHSSSNLWGNMYIDIKRILKYPHLYMLLLHQLACLIENNEELDFDSLLCVSNNGAAIATMLGCMIGKDVKYLMHVGPQMYFSDVTMLKNHASEKKYLFIFDFISTGNEYKTSRALIKSYDSVVVGAIGCSHYLLPDIASDEDEKITSLFYINDDILDKTQEYKLFAKKDEVVNWINSIKKTKTGDTSEG